MNITLENIGFIKKTRIDLSKNLIILCGPNNTGKTYVAYILHGLYYLNKSSRRIPTYISTYKHRSELREKGQTKIVLQEILEAFTTKFPELISHRLRDNLENIFATNNAFFSKSKINIELSENDLLNLQAIALNIEINDNIIDEISKQEIQIIKKKKEDFITIKINSISTSTSKETSIRTVSETIIRSVVLNIEREFRNYLIKNSFIAPVERNAISIFSKELALRRVAAVDILLGNDKEDDPLDFITRRAKRYPLPIRVGLEITEDISNIKKNRGEFENIAEIIENEILKGRISLNKDGDIQFLPNNKKNLKLPIHFSASSIKSWSSIVLFFKHIAQIGDIVIIDEPELNLHPDNQVLVARIIVRLTNLGFKVVISTHSEHIIREINNQIRISKIKDHAFLKKLGYDKDNIIKKENIQALLFNYEKQNIDEIKISNDGFSVKTIDTTINKLNNNTDLIIDKLFEERNG